MPFDQPQSRTFKSVGARIRAARQSLKYTQSQLATPEFSVSYISAIERGQIQPSLRALEILAKRLGIPSVQLIQLDTQNEQALGYATSVAESDEALIELTLLEAHISILQGDAIKAITLLNKLPSSKLQKKYLLQHRFLLGWAYLLTSELHKCIVTLAEGESFANEQNDSSNTLHIYDLMGIAYASMGDDARALLAHERCLNILEATQPQDPFFLCHLYNQLGQHYAQLQKYDAAIHAFKQAIIIIEELNTPENLQRAYWDNALHFAAAKEYQSASIYLHKCLELQNKRAYAPLRSEIYHYLGRALMKGDQAQARTYLENALQQKPDLLDALTLASIMTRLAEWFFLHNQLPEAEKYAEKASELARPFGTTLITSEALIMWGRIQYAHESYKSADKHFAAGLEMLEHLSLPQEQSDQLALYAQLLDARGKTKEALHYYKRAYEFQRIIHDELSPAPAIPQHKEQWLEKGLLLDKAKRYDEALTAFDRAIALDLENASTYRSKGLTLYNLKRYDEALTVFNQTLDLDPNDIATYRNKADTLCDLKRYDEVLTVFDQALALDPNQGAVYYRKGIILENLKRYQEALAAYEQAVRLDPNLEESNITENSRNLLMRIEAVQQFLVEAGFDFSIIPDSTGYIAASSSIWYKRFPKGLYVQVLFDDPLDRRTVESIYQNAKEYSDHALVVINRQPEISGWMAINLLRGEEKDYRFVCLPIAESLIKEGNALNKELQTLRFYISQRLGKDYDPYDVRDPVYGAVSFFGRQSLTEEILSALRRGHRLGLFGIHKMGKSSVLQELQKRTEFPVAYVYLRTHDNLLSIYRRILENWSIDSRIKYPNFKWVIPQPAKDTDPKVFFDSAARQLLTQLGGVTDIPLLAVFLDEIEHIVPYTEGDKKSLHIYVNLMDSLRGLQQETGSLSLLVAGIHPDMARRNYFWGNQKNPMHQIISEKFLLPLNEEDCSYMIRSLGQQINLSYEEDALDFIIEISGAHPFLARQVCSSVYKNWKNTSTISKLMIQNAALEFVKNPATASYFDDHGLWAELGKPSIWGEDVSHTNHKILCALASSSDGLPETEIYSRLNKKTADQAFSALKERGIVSSSGSPDYYRITFGLFRDWIRLHKLDLEV